MKVQSRTEKEKRNKKSDAGSFNARASETASRDDVNEINDDPLSISAKDANFQTELDYEGYDEIEESDNNEWNADVKGKGDPERKLELKDRSELNSGEEDHLDQQENRQIMPRDF